MSRYFPLSVLTCLRGSTCSPDFPAHPSTPAFVPGWFASLLGLHVLCWVEAGSLLQPDSQSADDHQQPHGNYPRAYVWFVELYFRGDARI